MTRSGSSRRKSTTGLGLVTSTRIAVAVVAIALAGCGDDGGSEDATGDSFDGFDWTDGLPDVTSDHDVSEPTDPLADIDPSTAGWYIAAIPSEAAPDGGIVVRVSYPGSGDARHAQGAPVVVIVPGGHGGGELGLDEVDPITAAAGVVLIRFLLPGSGDRGFRSGGVFDYRGPDCKRALADVMRYAAGEITDEYGFDLTDRVAHADVTNTGMVGESNGGNLALTALADHASLLSSVDWLSCWESPVGDQYVTGELGTVVGPTFNPYYVAGTCGVEACPWPGFSSALAWDSTETATITDPDDGDMWPIVGLFFLDLDDNGVMGEMDFAIDGLAGPGSMHEGDHLPWLYYSAEVAAVLDSRLDDFFPIGKPVWMASPDDIRAYWAERDGSLVLGDVHAAYPDLLVMILGSQVDHVQSQPDHPHLRSMMQGLSEAGHAWVRVNPDSAYMAELSGMAAADIPELDAGAQLAFPGTGDALAPESLQGHLVTASVMELVDRLRAGDTSADLDSLLY